MQFSIPQDTFARALNRVVNVAARVAPHRDAEDITTHLLMEVKDSTLLEITATDLSMEARVSLKITGGKKGACTANAVTFNNSVSGLPSGALLEVAFAKEEIVVKSGRARFSLVTLPAKDYGVFSGEDPAKGASRFAMPPADLRRLLLSALPCAADDETRYYLTGIYLHIQDGKLHAAATDGFRLALASIPVPKGAEKMKGVIVPRKAVQTVVQFIDGVLASEDASQPVQIEADENTVRFTLAKASLMTKLIDGAFPDYTRVVPKNNETLLKAEPRAFLAGLKRALIIAAQPDQSQAVRLALSKGEMTLSANAATIGAYEDKMDVTFDADDLEISFNGKMLSELVGQFSASPKATAAKGDDDEEDSDDSEATADAGNASSSLCVKFLDSTSPLLMHAEGGEKSLVYVLMPLRT